MASQSFVLSEGLEAQRQLLPWGVGLLAIFIPLLGWSGAQAMGGLWVGGALAALALSLAVLVQVGRWTKAAGRKPEDRLRAHTLACLLCALSVTQAAAGGVAAGPEAGLLLTLTMIATCLLMVFCAPVLETLLIVAPVSCAGPVLALLVMSGAQASESLVWTSLALGLISSMIFNLTLRRQFAAAAEREDLIKLRAQAQGEAEILANSKSQILATLSHEIRNGLAGVIHVLAAAAGHGERPAPPSRAQLAAALNAAHDLVGVLDATLDTETAEQGRLGSTPEPFDPVQLAEDIVLLHRPMALAKGLEINLFIERSLRNRVQGQALGDPARVRQILGNLLGNAVKYTVRGRIELRLEAAGEGRVRFAVADTGPGLSESELKDAFEPFRRVERTGAGIPGAGLGLSLSRRLAQLMDGAIEARSAVGAGSWFALNLPFDAAAGRSPADAPSAPAHGGLRVLLAEDDSLSAAMMRAVLEQLGHQVVHAQNGKRAVELCKIGEFDLMVFDGRMPAMDGAAAARAVRALPNANAKAPIIAVIAGDLEEADACTAAGANAVLRKPLSVASLARAVADAMAAEPASAFKQAVA